MHRLSPSALLLLCLLLSGSLLPVRPTVHAAAAARSRLVAAGPVLPGPALVTLDPADDTPDVLPTQAVAVDHPGGYQLPAAPRPQLRPWTPQQTAFFHLSRPPPLGA